MDFTDLLCRYVSILRGLGLVHHNNHWTVKGAEFYGQHQLFERIYKSAQENADAAAEKFVGLFGVDCLDMTKQASFLSVILENANKNGDKPLVSSLELETSFLDFSKEFYSMVEKEDKMSLGLDDLIMKIASDREEAVYLLKQSLKTNEGINKLSNLSKKFQYELSK